MELNQDILDAIATVSGKRILQSRRKHKVEWKRLFDFYNKSRDTTLCVDCLPCYITVFQFAKEKMKQEESELKANEFRSNNIV